MHNISDLFYFGNNTLRVSDGLSVHHQESETSTRPCILIYFYSKTNQMHNIWDLFYFGNNTLHVSDGLSVRHHESETSTRPCILIYFYSKTNQMHNISDLFYFGNNTLHVSDGKQPQNLYDIYLLLYVSWWTERPSETRRVLLPK